jgi:hypothetical protein
MSIVLPKYDIDSLMSKSRADEVFEVRKSTISSAKPYLDNARAKATSTGSYMQATFKP